jgi:Zn-dependent protease
MLRSWKIGHWFGIDIYVHWTFLLLPALAFARTFGDGGAGLAAFVAALVTVTFGCVLLHELGHALMARWFGIVTRDITLYPIGGVARLERMSRRPWEEFCIALAGPAVNLVIAAVLFLVLAPVSFLTGGHRGDGFGVSDFLLLLMLSNVVLVVFNMIPGFPMDGGRVFRAVLASFLPYPQATAVAAGLGRVIALLFVFVGLMNITGVFCPPGVRAGQLAMLTLIGFFLYVVGQQELAMVRRREADRRAAPLDVLPVGPAAEGPPPATGFTGFTWDGRAGLWIRWHNGRPIHAIAVEPE